MEIGKENFAFAVNSESRKHLYLPGISRTCAVETMKVGIMLERTMYLAIILLLVQYRFHNH